MLYFYIRLCSFKYMFPPCSFKTSWNCIFVHLFEFVTVFFANVFSQGRRQKLSADCGKACQSQIQQSNLITDGFGRYQSRAVFTNSKIIFCGCTNTETSNILVHEVEHLFSTPYSDLKAENLYTTEIIIFIIS